MVRLGNTDYQRPTTTYQESLTDEAIKEKLQGFTKVEDISTVPLQTNLRYFVYKTDSASGKTERLFRVGGRLLNKDNYQQYIVLTNGRQSWSVNTETAVFFRQLTVQEVTDKYETKIRDLKKTIQNLQRQLGGRSST